jgi:hypothetical protein
MNNITLSKLTFWLLFTGVSLALILVIAVSVAQNPGVNNGTDVAPGLSREVIKARYYTDVAELVKDYLTTLGDLGALSVTSPYLDATKAAKNDALELLVPEEAKAMHLDLVVALNFLEKGFNGSQKDLAEGVKRLERVLNENSWLNE